jgi:hypothetical protein
MSTSVESTVPSPPLSEARERVVPEDQFNGTNFIEQEAEADGSGEGGGDESDSEGDEEDPAEADLGDDVDEAEPSSEPHRAKAKGNRTPLPSWLQLAFEARVQECKDRNTQGSPRLYWFHKTFWFPSQSTWFLLQTPIPAPHRLFNPRFFLWDPLALTKVPCPNCKHELGRHTHIARPRRVVSFTSTFWIIGFRYKCPRCTRTRLEGQRVTFRSWDSRILASIPPELAAEFPAKLSHRCAIDLDTFEFMRSMFQNGLGSKQFSDALRVQHRLRYHKLELQYLQHLSSRSGALAAWRGPRYEAFLPFGDKSANGRHGYIPSGRWLRDMYDSYIETYSRCFDQHMALLPAEVSAIDHSHKVSSIPIHDSPLCSYHVVHQVYYSAQWGTRFYSASHCNKRAWSDPNVLPCCHEIALAI